MKQKNAALALLCALALCVLTACGSGNAAQEPSQSPSVLPQATAKGAVPALPDQLEKNDEGIPVLQVYVTDEDKTRQMDIETYLQGVLAGEMKNDWPTEALKAQAILARTFVLKFCSEKKSKYENADISTDIEEAQAYDETGVNDRIIQAVDETRGMVLSDNGTLPYAWFHAHSGGTTALAKEGLGYADAEPEYTQVVKGNESDNAPEDAKTWEKTFSEAEVLSAAREAGVKAGEALSSAAVGETGESGRAVTILLNGKAVSAPELRIALGSDKMRSTLLTDLKLADGGMYMAGKGYGHGVGMPQWGAYGMAENGKTAEEIVTYYFKNCTVEKVW